MEFPVTKASIQKYSDMCAEEKRAKLFKEIEDAFERMNPEKVKIVLEDLVKGENSLSVLIATIHNWALCLNYKSEIEALVRKKYINEYFPDAKIEMRTKNGIGGYLVEILILY